MRTEDGLHDRRRVGGGGGGSKWQEACQNKWRRRIKAGGVKGEVYQVSKNGVSLEQELLILYDHIAW
jgi:hypothetical protein